MSGVKVKIPTSDEKVKYWTKAMEHSLGMIDDKVLYHTQKIKRLRQELEMVEAHLELAMKDYVAKKVFYEGRIESAAKKSDTEQNGSA
jgi:hypothetical protein